MHQHFRTVSNRLKVSEYLASKKAGEAGPAVRCTFPADMECRARNLLQYLYENTVMPSQAADVLADCCTVGQVEVLNAGC